MPLKKFYCIEGHHFFEEDDPAGAKRTHNKAICVDCTRKILSKFFTTSDGVRMSTIYENYVDDYERKKIWRKNAEEVKASRQTTEDSAKENRKARSKAAGSGS